MTEVLCSKLTFLIDFGTYLSGVTKVYPGNSS